MRELTDEQIDYVLTDYDKSEFQLRQRRFIARLAVQAMDAARYKAALEMIAQIRAISGSPQGHFRSTLWMVDAVLAGADVRDLETVEAIEKGTWKP
jgi:hypothetical protein